VRRVKEEQSKEEITNERYLRMRQDGISVLPPVGNKSGVFFILEHKRMSDVVDRYLTRSKPTSENQYNKNLKFFKVPEANIQSIYSKLVMRVFDVFANILKYMYSTRFSGGSTRSETSPEAHTY
jgi:hypothetical protein